MNKLHQKRRPLILKAIAILTLMAVNVTIKAQNYTLTELGTLGGQFSGANGINEQGQVVGQSTIIGGASHAFFWSGGEMSDLGVPGGYLASGATGINSNGQIVGYANGPNLIQFAYLYENNQWTNLGTLAGYDLEFSWASDINNNSQIVGYSYTLGPGTGMRAWIWEDSVMTDLGTLGGEKSFADNINDLGQVVGYAQYDPNSSQSHAFIWQNGIMTDLGTLPGDVNSAANDINDMGQICGSSYNQSNVHRPCLWDNGQVIDLGLLPGHVSGIATGINNNGQVVGWMLRTFSGADATAFIWENGVLTDLNQVIPPYPDWVLHTASDINNSGQIVGSWRHPSGMIQAYLLTPIANGTNDEIQSALSTEFISSTSYPNPFNAQTNIQYSLSEPNAVTIEIYDLLGRIVETIEEANKSAGEHLITWNADKHPSGVYFYRIQVGDYSETKKMVLQK
jgi:probable HAF family extracellular repeat protein